MSDSVSVEHGAEANNAGATPDADLAAVRAVLAGNVDAFAVIVSRWQTRMVNLAWRFCRDHAMAEDMAQEAFIRAFRALHTFRGDAAFSTWLTAIAMNSYRTFLRSRPPAPTLIDVVSTSATDAVSQLLTEERASTIRKLVLLLPKRYREPLTLFYFEEMNVAKTASILGIPEGTLKARLYRGRELLKRRLAETPRPEGDRHGRD